MLAFCETRSVGCVLIALCGWLFAETALAEDIYDLIDAGSDLSPDGAQALEDQLIDEPNAVATRTRLIGYYWEQGFGSAPARQLRADHVLYLIEHSPTAEVLSLPHGTVEPHFSPLAYADGSRFWEGHLGAEKMDAAVLRNAANFWGFHEAEKAKAALRRGMKTEPDSPEWPESLGHHVALGVIRAPQEAKPAIATEALAYFEQAYELSDPMLKSFLLPELADLALAADRPDQARAYAQQMLEHPFDPDDWNAGNNFHVAHQVLGAIALDGGDLDNASQHLIESGRTPGSPQLDSFGPQMQLAARLLEAGQDQAVIRYLELCAEFWEMGRDELTEWKQAIRAGQEPGWQNQMVY